MIETVFLVPMTDNAGQPFPPAVWDALDEPLIADFGAYSRAPGVQGVWTTDQRIYRDTSIQYTIALASWWQLPDWLALITWLRVTFAQEAIYVKVAGIVEVYGG